MSLVTFNLEVNPYPLRSGAVRPSKYMKSESFFFVNIFESKVAYKFIESGRLGYFWNYNSVNFIGDFALKKL